MSIFADAARVITNLSSLGSQLIGVDANLSIPSIDSAFSGEQLAAIATGMTGDLGGALAGGAKMLAPGIAGGIQTIMTRDRGRVMELPADAYEAAYEKHVKGIYRVSQGADKFKEIGAKTGSIILSTLNVVDVLELMTGLGPPCEGGDLNAGSAQFTALYEQLASAFPDNSWRGSGSQAYGDCNANLRALAQAMADLDVKLADIVRNQADWVDHMRLGFSILKPNLVAAVAIEFAMRWALAPAGELAAKIFAITVSALALAAATAFIGTLLGMSIENGQKADGIAADYTRLAAAARLTGTRAHSEVDAAGKSVVSGFDPIGSAGQHAFPRARAGGDESLEDGQSKVRETTEGSPGQTVGLTMPSLAQLMQMSGQPAAVSGYAAQPMNMFNQMMGQAQQATAMSRQGRGAAPAEEAAPEEGVLAGDVEGAGAGLGAQAGERAPAEATGVGAERARGAQSGTTRAVRPPAG